tara:strand:- start:77 stop:241 length:165 start_codon:yes stop_codon:yes gene_type:complete
MKEVNYKKMEEELVYHEENVIPKLRWLQVKTLVEQFPNDKELGARVRILATDLK